MLFLLRSLEDLQLIKVGTDRFPINPSYKSGYGGGAADGIGPVPTHCEVTTKGFEKIIEFSKGINSKTAFIAMWFHDSMEGLELEKSIEKSVKKQDIPLLYKKQRAS